MASREIKIPRHTIIAPYGKRLSSFFIDLAISGLTFLLLYFFIFNPIFSNFVTSEDNKTLIKYEVDSHLVTKNESGGTDIISTVDDYDLYLNAMHYFYFNYLSGVDIKEEDKAPNYNQEFKDENGNLVLPKDYYTVEWYNYNVLGINIDDPESEKSTCYFTYQKVGDEYDKSQVGIPRTVRYNPDIGSEIALTGKDIAGYLKPIYQDAYYRLTAQNFYQEVHHRFSFFNGLSITIPLTLTILVTHLIIPLFFKFGSTLGKRINGLGLASIDGYRFKKPQLVLRFVPFLVVTVFMTLAYELNLLTLVVIIFAVFLASVSLSLATAKKVALHDLTARTLVIDYKASIIFDNQVDELAYIEKEDRGEFDKKTKDKLDDKDKYDNETEEPEISYEK